MLLFDGGGGGGSFLAAAALRLNESRASPKMTGWNHRNSGTARQTLMQRRQAEDESNSNYIESAATTTTETIAMTQAYDNSFWAEDSTRAAAAAADQRPQFVGPDFSPGQQNMTSASNTNMNQAQLEQSFSDWWQEYWSRQPFPSGYTQSSITMLACFISTIIFLIVVGNLLVCIAIFTEKSLKPTQNWFIASLAVSDMLLGLVVMPFSLARELMGFWIFGPLWCDIHEALDVLLTTASINTLCLISLDRYWSITQAVSYLKKRTPKRGAFMIAFVWVFSAAVSLPPLFGWKKQSPSAQGPAQPSQHVNVTEQQQRIAAAGRQRATTLAAAANAAVEIGEDEDEELREGRENRPHRSRRRRRRSRFQQQQSPNEDLLNALQQSAPPRPPHFIPSASLSELIQQQKQLARPEREAAPPNYAYLLVDQQQQVQLQQQQQQQAQNLAVEYPTCQLSDDVGYVLYSALGSFYIPCAVMVFTYIKIFLAARSRARRAINKQARAAHNQGGGGASSKKNQRSGQQNQLNAGHGATIAGLTSGRANKQHALTSTAGDSTLLLASTNSMSKLTGSGNSAAANGDHNHHYRRRQDSDPAAANDANLTSGKHEYRRNHQQQQQQAPNVIKGKLVVVERRKSTVSPATAVAVPTTTTVVCKPPAEVCKPPLDAEDCVSATITTSCAKQATVPYSTTGSGEPCGAALNASVSCDGMAQAAAAAAVAKGATPCLSSATCSRKPTNESNDSSLMTVMSASMTELPQVTRFNFKQQQQQDEARKAASSSSSQANNDQEKQMTAKLLRAISQAGRELSEENLVKEIGKCDNNNDDKDNSDGKLASDTDNNKHDDQLQQLAPNHSTNETCFMTIEEDSDNLEAQTGRTIMMIASTARQSSASLAGKNQAGMAMTMMPAAALVGGGGRGQGSAHTDQAAICTNAACLRRRQRRSNRHGSSYCGSSMTIDNDVDEEEEMDDDDEMMHIHDDEREVEDDVDDEECLEDDDLLTDDCNGYSGSCGLDQYCNTSACTHCRECAALAGSHDDDINQDSPRTCNYNSKSSLQDSPQLIHHTTCEGRQMRSAANRQQGGNKSEAGNNCAHVHPHGDNHNQRQQHYHHHHLKQGTACSETEGQSLTGDDNLSLTDYYHGGSQEENSSIVGHDVLDATPAEERTPRRHNHDHKRRSIVASAFASMGGGFKGMTSIGQQQHQSQTDEANEGGGGSGVVGRKKSSIGFHLARFAGSGAASQSGGGLLALAAAQSQQQQQHASVMGGQQQQPPTRNLKTLRQNFFHKLNQLTAKSAAKQAAAQNNQTPTTTTDGGKSSAQSSYGSSYEPSVDYATTSNMPSVNDHYLQETTFGENEIDSYADPRSTLGETQNRQAGGQQFRTSKLLTIAQQTAKQQMMASGGYQTSGLNNNNHAPQMAREVDQRQLSGSSQDVELGGGPAGTIAAGKLGSANNDDDNNELVLIRQPQPLDNSAAIPANKSNCNNIKVLRLDLNHDNINSNGHDNISGFNHADRGLATGAGTLAGDQLDHMGGKSIVSLSGDGGPVKRRPDGRGTLSLVGPKPRATDASGGSGNNRQGGGGGGSSTNNSAGGTSRAYLASDNERHKRKLAKARERRATLILGLIMAAFVCSWMPFFTFYVIRALCVVCRDYISPRFEAFIFWMGYCNSAINPIIYTIFNRDFRKAFRKILFKCL